MTTGGGVSTDYRRIGGTLANDCDILIMIVKMDIDKCNYLHLFVLFLRFLYDVLVGFR